MTVNEPLPIYEIVRVEWDDTNHCRVEVKTPRGGLRTIKVVIPLDLLDESVADHVQEVVHSIVMKFRSRDEASAKLVGQRLHVQQAGRGNKGGDR